MNHGHMIVMDDMIVIVFDWRHDCDDGECTFSLSPSKTPSSRNKLLNFSNTLEKFLEYLPLDPSWGEDVVPLTTEVVEEPHWLTLLCRGESVLSRVTAPPCILCPTLCSSLGVDGLRALPLLPWALVLGVTMVLAVVGVWWRVLEPEVLQLF